MMKSLPENADQKKEYDPDQNYSEASRNIVVTIPHTYT